MAYSLEKPVCFLKTQPPMVQMWKTRPVQRKRKVLEINFIIKSIISTTW